MMKWFTIALGVAVFTATIAAMVSSAPPTNEVSAAKELENRSTIVIEREAYENKYGPYKKPITQTTIDNIKISITYDCNDKKYKSPKFCDCMANKQVQNILGLNLTYAEEISQYIIYTKPSKISMYFCELTSM